MKHIEPLDGNYQGFAQHTNIRDRRIIFQCCYNLLENNISLPLREKENIKILLNKLGKRNIKQLVDYRETVGDKQDILEKPQLGHGINALLAGKILPALVTAFVK